MFVLGSQVLNPNRGFTHPETGIQYPANWLRSTTLAEKEAIGIRELPDYPHGSWDQKFYWGRDDDGVLLPKDHAQLVTQWVAQTRQTANSLLAQSDWMVVREADNGTAVSTEWRTWRESIRTSAADKVAAIEATADTDAIAAYITGGTYNVWPNDPNFVDPAGDSVADGVVADGDGADAG